MNVLTNLLTTTSYQLQKLESFASIETPMRYLDDNTSDNSINSLIQQAAHMIKSIANTSPALSDEDTIAEIDSMFELPLPNVLLSNYEFDPSSLIDFDLFKQLTQALALPKPKVNDEIIRIVRGEPEPKRKMVEETPPPPTPPRKRDEKAEMKEIHASPSPMPEPSPSPVKEASPIKPQTPVKEPTPVEMEVEEPAPRSEHAVEGLLDHTAHFILNLDGVKSLAYEFNTGEYTVSDVAFRGQPLRLKNRAASVSFERNGINVILVSGGSYSNTVSLFSYENGVLVGSDLPQKLIEAR